MTDVPRCLIASAAPPRGRERHSSAWRGRLAAGDPREALRDLARLRRRNEPSGLDHPWTPMWFYSWALRDPARLEQWGSGGLGWRQRRLLHTHAAWLATMIADRWTSRRTRARTPLRGPTRCSAWCPHGGPLAGRHALALYREHRLRR